MCFIVKAILPVVGGENLAEVLTADSINNGLARWDAFGVMGGIPTWNYDWICNQFFFFSSIYCAQKIQDTLE